MKNLKKCLSLSLAICLIVSLLPITAWADTGDVCEIVPYLYNDDGESEALAPIPFSSLDNALNDHGASIVDEYSYYTIRLLDNVDYHRGLVITGQEVSFELNGFILEITNTDGTALEVGEDGAVRISGDGALNVSATATDDFEDYAYGVFAYDGGTAEVTNATVTNEGCPFPQAAVYAESGGIIVVQGDASAHGDNTVVVDSSSGGIVSVLGDVTLSSGSNCSGISVINDSKVYVQGDVQGNGTGIDMYYFADDDTPGGEVTIDGDFDTASLGIFSATEPPDFELHEMTNSGTGTGAFHNYRIYTDGYSTVRLRDSSVMVCTVDDTAYGTLHEALAATDGDGTIALLGDFTWTGYSLSPLISVIDKTLTIDTNENALAVVNQIGTALEVGAGGSVSTLGSGTFSVTGSGGFTDSGMFSGNETDGCGVYAHGGGTAEVTNATVIDGLAAALAAYGGTIEVLNDVTVAALADFNGMPVGAMAYGSAEKCGSVTVRGDIRIESGKGTGGTGADTSFGGLVTVVGDIILEVDDAVDFVRGASTYGGTVTIDGDIRLQPGAGSNEVTGADATEEGVVTVNGSIFVSNAYDAYGVTADGGTVNVEKDITIEGSYSIGISARNESVITISGNITAAGEYSTGAELSHGGTAIMGGNITVTGNDSTGIDIFDDSVATVEGTITGDTYISFNGTEKARADGAPGAGADESYFIYSSEVPSDDGSTVRVRGIGIITDSLPAAAVGTSYTGTTITYIYRPLSDPGSPIRFSATGLPSGLSVDADTGIISGTPTGGSGTPYTVKLVITDGALRAQKTLSLAVSGDSPSGNSSSGGTATPKYEAPVSGDSSGSLTVTVDGSGSKATAVLGAAQSELLRGGKTVAITMPKISGVSHYTLALPVAELSADNHSGTLTLHTAYGSVAVPSDMLTGTSASAGNNAQITLAAVNTADLSENARTAVGNRPIVSLSLSVDGAQIAWSNPAAPATVGIPYTPSAGEDPNAIVVYYIDGKGNLNVVTNGHYDAQSGTVTFHTTHFSLYAVGYNQVRFSDVADSAWYAAAVNSLAARGITSGTAATTFSPGATLTRGQFITLLLRTYGIRTDASASDNFTDAGDTYYTSYLAAAKNLKITSGIGGNKFAPDKAITRQEMFTLLYNALTVLGKLPTDASDTALSDFADSRSIALWANDAMSALVKAGTISGSNGALNPTGTTTRAEMAQVLYNLQLQ